jgi:hypothetical protein
LAWLVKAGTMKRKLKWIGVVLVLLVLGFGTVLFLLPRNRITVEAWQQIRLGMTKEEVESILGGPGIPCAEFLAQNARIEKAIGKPHLLNDGKRLMEPEWLKFDEDKIKVWFAGRGLIAIDFDQGFVKGKVFEGVRSADPSFLDRLRDWLGW